MLFSALHRWTALSVIALLLLQGVPFVPLVEYGHEAAACEHCTGLWCLITECSCPHHERGHRHGDEKHADASGQHDEHMRPTTTVHDTAADKDCARLCGCDQAPMQSVAVSAVDKVVVREAAVLIFDDRAQPFSLSIRQVVPQRVADDIFHPPRAQG